MRPKDWIGLLTAGVFVASCAQAPMVANNHSPAPVKGELTEEQAYKRAAELYKAVGKEVDRQMLRLSLAGRSSQRYWRVHAQGEGTVSLLSFDSRTGILRDFIDKDPGDRRSGQPSLEPRRLSDSELESKVKRFLEQAGFEQELTRPRFVGEPTKDDVYTEIYEIHNGLPVRDNVIEIGFLASDGSIFFAGAGFGASAFAGTVKIETGVAKLTAQAERTTNEKAKEFRLWYARLQDSKNSDKYVSEVARPYYIAKYRGWDEVWIDAETGKVARDYRPR